MDIVSRLKTFINYVAIPVTQFADNCKIPRPTLSQLLNGRNKKVSDELITKIHEGYPQLSVLWLMFGEGDMLHTQNIETSAAKNNLLFDFSDTQQPKTEPSTPRLDFDNTFMDSASNNFETEKADAPAVNSMTMDVSPLPTNPERKDSKATLSFSSEQAKKIVNIIVYYNDNSFESFVPSPEK